ncbi:MAG: hypothetical protein V3V14_09060 [Saprospiraceae bacterium]
METFLEILKYILPALIVFGTVYFIMTKFLDQQYGLETLKFKQNHVGAMLPMKLQAYERMAVLCERISLDNLSYRLSVSNMDAKSLGNAMMIAIQQEYEHNLGQQIYISKNLWEIITTAKNQTQNIVSSAMADPKVGSSPAALVQKAMELQNEMGGSPIKMAKIAIKKEIDIVL